jgi:general secretion pathway protein N
MSPRAAGRHIGAAPIGLRDRVLCASLRRLITAPRLCQLLMVAAIGAQVSSGHGNANADTARRAQARLGPDPSIDAGLAALIGNPIAEVPMDRLSATRDRPLFSPSRRPAVPPQTRPPPSMSREPAPPPSPVQAPSVALFGIVVSEEGPRAFIAMGPTDSVFGVRPGDDLNGWRVTAITKRSLVLSRADLSATFMLFSQENASRTAHFDAATLSQQVQRTPNVGHPRVRIR